MRASYHLGISLLLCCGCASFRGDRCEISQANGPSICANKTLLSWSNSRNEGAPNSDTEGENGKNGKQASDEGQEPPEPIATDRPDFTEASSTVGKGRIQLEAGYTYIRDRSAGVATDGHSYPEALVRIGTLADWLELRIGQNYGHTRVGSPHAVFGASGAEDLYLGIKLGITEQHRILPEMALILQSTVPTGHREFSAGKVQPGYNWLYGWDIVPDRLTMGGSSQANLAVDATGHGYVELAQALTIGYILTDKLSAYTEWFAFFPAGAVAPGVSALHYLDGGFTYKVTPNFQLDIRAGMGLSRQADDFFVGSGFAVRY